MDNVVLWDAEANPIGKAIERVLYDIRTEDKDGLIYDAVTLQDVIEDSDGYLATFDALVTPYARLDRKIRQLFMVMNKAVPDFKIAEYQISKPFKQRGGVHVLVTFELMDGQAILVFFHVPTVDPKRILPTDELVSWKWMINKKDVTIVVAPEKGKDIPVREVGRRIMKLAQRNSSAFQRANEKRAERLKEISDYEKEIAELEAELASLLKQIEVAKLEHEERELKALETPSMDDLKLALSENGWEASASNDEIMSKSFNVHSESKVIKILLNDGEIEIIGNNELKITDQVKIKGSRQDIIKKVNEKAQDLALSAVDQEKMKILIDGLTNKGHSVEVLAPLEIVVTTRRASEKFEIGLDDDADFTVESSTGMTVEHINHESNPSVIVKAIDDGDFVQSHYSDEEDPELDESVIQGGVFKGKTYEFAQAIEAIELAVNQLPELSVVFGNFDFTAKQNTLFDSVLSESSPPIYGMTAQIGYTPTGVVLARVHVDERGEAKVYKGESGLNYAGQSDNDVDKFVQIFKQLINELTPVQNWEDTIPLVKEYLEQFTPLRRGQIVKQLSKTAYDFDGVRQTVAENIIKYVQMPDSYVGEDAEGNKTVFFDGMVLAKKLGRLAINFGIWLIEHKNMGTRANQKDSSKVFTAKESEQLVKAIEDDIYSYKMAIKSYEQSDAINSLEKLINQAEVMLDAQMESDSDRTKLVRLLPTAKLITSHGTTPNGAYELDSKISNVLEKIENNDIEFAKGLSEYEFEYFFGLLAERGYHQESHKLTDLRNKEDEPVKISPRVRVDNDLAIFAYAVERIEAQDVSYAKNLSRDEFNLVYALLTDRNYHTEAEALTALRNYAETPEPEPTPEPRNEYSYFVVKKKLGEGKQSKNTGYIKPIIGNKFTDEELSEMKNLLEESKLINTVKIENGLIYVQSNQYDEDIQETVEKIISLKLTKKELKDIQDREERRLYEEQRSLEIDKNINKNSKVKQFIETYFSGINDYNKEKMALFLNGDDDVFNGRVNGSFISGAETLQVVNPELGEIDWDKLKQVFNNQSQLEPTPEPIIEPTPEPIVEPTPEPIIEPIEPIMQTVEQFLDEVIKDPSKLLNSQNYEKLDNVLDNFETLSNDIQEKAEKALELYSAYSFKALADLAQNGESGPLPS